MQIRKTSSKMAICCTLLTSTLPFSKSRAAPQQTKSIRTSADKTKPSGFGLDIFIGGDGAFISSSPLEPDESAKQGSLYGGKSLISLVNKNLEIEAGGGYFKTLLKGDIDIVESDSNDGGLVRRDNTKISTDAGLIELSGRIRLNEGTDGDAIWSIGPTASALIGTNASFGPDSKKVYRTAVFAGAQLALTFGKKWKPRLVGSYITDVNLHERQIHIALLSLQIGYSLLTPLTVIKELRTQTTDETLRKVTVERTVERAVVKESVRLLLDSEVVNFETNKATLLKRSETFLNELGLILAQNPERWSFLTIEGHTDFRGQLEYNNKLSLERATSVRDALARAGVPANRIRALGYGPNRPIDPANNELAWARNRRVELNFEGVSEPKWLREVLQKLRAALASSPR